MNLITDKFNALTSDEKIKKAFREILEEFTHSAFGSISKRDIEILLFMKLQDLEILPLNPDIYEVITMLKITRSKATSLIYESNLRRSDEESLKSELKALLEKPLIDIDGNKEVKKIIVEVSNPYLRDYIKSLLKKAGHVSDASFSSEIIRMSLAAFTSLIYDVIEDKEAITEKLVEVGAKPDTSLKGILFGLLKTAGSKLAGKVGEDLLNEFSEYIVPILRDNLSTIPDKIIDAFKSDE